jgi:glycosyltransferase involved in cell wall biosynthesis
VIPVLFLAWYFPPVGGAGVQRSLKFARFLPEHGVRPVVLAGPAAQGSRWAPADASLAAEVPPDLVVLRAERGPEPRPRDRRWQRLTGADPALAACWRAFVLDAGARAAAAHRPRAIVVTLGPYECLAGALALGKELALPVIADLRDPWALDEMRAYGHRLQQYCDQRRMRQELARCAAVIMNTPAATQMLCSAVPTIAGDRAACITNGYDAGDFAAPPPAAPRDGRFRIVHTGYLHSDSALAADRRLRWRDLLLGGSRGVDLWGRTHRYLLAAIDRLASDAPALAERIEVHLHGVPSPADEAETARSPRSAQVRAFGYRPHAETVAAMRAADLLFLPMQGLPPGQPASIVPGKTYEYLASGRPILAAVPDGDARDFVQAAGAGVAVAPDDVDGMVRALRGFVAAGRATDRPLGAAVARFERRRLTAQLADVVRRTVGAA